MCAHIFAADIQTLLLVHLGKQTRVLGQPLGFVQFSVVIEPVKTPYLVRAVIGTESCADAPVVDHLVQAVRAVDGGVHRAYVLARRLLALLTGHGLVEVGGLVDVTLVVVVDPDPVHLAADGDLTLADDGDVVLRLAGNHAGVAADARAQINRHTPGVPEIFHWRIK